MVVIRRTRTFLFVVLCLILTGRCNDDPGSGTGTSPYPDAEAQNIDGAELARAYNSANQVEGIRSLLVARNFKIVAEEYFNNSGPEPDTLNDVRSVTKSITATLIGIAIDKGHIRDVNQTLSEFLLNAVDSLDEEKGKITFHQLMTMTCGLEWHELGGYSEFGDWVRSPDQLLYILNKPFIDPPGTRFNYSDGAAHLMSVVLTEATGMSASEFAQTYLFAPLGIGPRYCYADNRGYSYGGVGLCISPRDMIKIGYLYLQNGVYDSVRIVSADWIEQATRSHVSTDNAVPFGPDYGYYWWVGREHGYDYYFANGYGGQFIFVVPDANLVIVATCTFRNMGSRAHQNWYEIISIIINRILPAVR